MNTTRLRRILASLRRLPRGQGLVEVTLLLPVLLIVLSGLIEFGFMLNEYMAIQDATRNAARFSSDGLYYAIDADHNCNTTRDFYRQTACLVNRELSQERPEVKLNFGDGHDDVIVSAFSITAGSGISATVTDRHPGAYGEAGWSGALDSTAWGVRNQNSRFTSSEISARLNSVAPSTGVLLVEIFYDYNQKLKLPWITAFLQDPVLLHSYVIMPLVSAEPTPTPMP
jgi:hypothetical protein